MTKNTKTSYEERVRRVRNNNIYTAIKEVHEIHHYQIYSLC